MNKMPKNSADDFKEISSIRSKLSLFRSQVLMSQYQKAINLGTSLMKDIEIYESTFSIECKQLKCNLKEQLQVCKDIQLALRANQKVLLNKKQQSADVSFAQQKSKLSQNTYQQHHYQHFDDKIENQQRKKASSKWNKAASQQQQIQRLKHNKLSSQTSHDSPFKQKKDANNYLQQKTQIVATPPSSYSNRKSFKSPSSQSSLPSHQLPDDVEQTIYRNLILPLNFPLFKLKNSILLLQCKIRQPSKNNLNGDSITRYLKNFDFRQIQQINQVCEYKLLKLKIQMYNGNIKRGVMNISSGRKDQQFQQIENLKCLIQNYRKLEQSYLQGGSDNVIKKKFSEKGVQLGHKISEIFLVLIVQSVAADSQNGQFLEKPQRVLSQTPNQQSQQILPSKDNNQLNQGFYDKCKEFVNIF